MAGDKFNLRVSSWYETNGTTPAAPANPLPDLLSALLTGIGGAATTAHGTTVAQLQSSGVLSPGATQFLTDQTYDANKPKAYLNWVLFDEQFKFVSDGRLV